ncbi:MAG: DUF2029 domain-containing protein [Gammaproteobacteria bacterium]|nr:DUF2029 domain-containing protein [Gammaproteobacteria bacterium]
MDFFNTLEFLKTYTYLGQDLAVYYPSVYWLFYPFAQMEKNFSFILFNAIFFINLYLFALYYVSDTNAHSQKFTYQVFIIPIVFLSFPVLYCFDRGNFEMMIFVLLSWSIIFFSQQRYYLSAIFLACAASTKIFPILFLLLFIKQKQFKPAIFTCVLFSLLCILPLFTLHGGFIANLSTVMTNTHHLAQSSFMLEGVRQTVSLMALFKISYLVQHPHATYNQFAQYVLFISPWYAMMTAVLTGLVSLYILACEETLWKQTMLITAMMLLFPPVSYDYKLIYLFIPLFLYLNHAEKEKDPCNLFYIIFFTLLLIPKNYHIFHLSLKYYLGRLDSLDISVSIFIDIFILTIFSMMLIFSRVPVFFSSEVLDHTKAKI